LLSYDRLSIKPLLFKSFTGLTVQEFDDIYDNQKAKRYDKMRNNVYHPSKEKGLEKEKQVL
jgi:hypothetical protein